MGVGGAIVRVNQGTAVLETGKEACGIAPASPPPCYKIHTNDFQFPLAGVSLDHRGFFQITREPCLQDPGRGPCCVGSESWVSGYVWECGLEAVPQAPLPDPPLTVHSEAEVWCPVFSFPAAVFQAQTIPGFFPDKPVQQPWCPPTAHSGAPSGAGIQSGLRNSPVTCCPSLRARGGGSPGFQPLKLVMGIQVNICSIDSLPVSSPWRPECQQEALFS